MAVPARRGTFTVTQSDGTVITLRLMGDEYFHYFQNVATGEKMLQSSDGDYYVVAESELSNRSVKAQTRRAAANAARAKRLPKRMVSADGRRKVGDIHMVSGNKKGLVILVNFSDKAMVSSHNQSAFSNQFNQEGYNLNGHIGSVHDYFYDQSYGKLNLTFDVVGPVTVSKNMSYYGANDSAGDDKYPATMIAEACKLADSQVNFADYDWDGDGEVDQVYVIYAGYAESQGASSSTIWPHEWQLSAAAKYGDGSGALKLDEVTIDTYACSSELNGKSGSVMCAIGTACHEFSHCLGFPDFYDTDGDAIGMSYFDVLDAGSYNGPTGYGEVPCGYTAYERFQAGWLEPEILDEAATITDMPAINDNNAQTYIIFNDKELCEYYLLENRQSRGWFKYFDTYTGGEGLFITHVDENESAWTNNTVNTIETHQRMSWVAADGDKTNSSSTGHFGDFFPGTSNKTSFTDAPLFNYNIAGNKVLQHSITEISENISAGTVSFLFDGGAIVDDGSRYTVTLDAGTGTCSTKTWTQSSFQESMSLPLAYAPNAEWQFVCWSTSPSENASAYPVPAYYSNNTFLPTSNVTLYAVYKSNASGSSISGDATLNYSDLTSEQMSRLGYGKALEYLAGDGQKWVIKAYDNSGFQINNKKDASIKVPNYFDVPITKITITCSTARVFSFSETDYSGSNSPTVVATSNSSKTATIDLSESNIKEGYIYTTDGATSITKIVVSYGGSSITYETYPGGSGLITPSVSFASSTETIFMGDTRDTFTAVVSGSTGAVTYTSSDETVATVGPTTGRVVSKGEGTTTITATVAAVEGVSKSASASYKLTVEWPALKSIAVTTPPTKTTYMEGEKFSKEGMIVMATYVNDYKEEAEVYSVTPDGALTTTDTEITITYKEGSITVTTTQAITVTPKPKYTVTFNPGSGSCSKTTLTETEYQSGVLLPEATSVSEEWAFAGWSTASVSETNARPTLYAPGSTYKPATDITLYAVYSLSETSGGSGNYELVTEELSDWSGNYLIAYSSTVFADGRAGGKDGIGKAQSHVNPGSNLSGTTVAAEWGDTYYVTFEAITNGYVMKTQDGLYNYRTTNTNGLDICSVLETASTHPITITFNSSTDIDLLCSKTAFHYNATAGATGEMFRFYKSGAQSNVYLYKKQGSLVSVTYNSNPNDVELVVPEVSFLYNSKTMLVGGTYTQTATVENSTGAVHYSSSDTKIATVDETTGKVKAVGVGTVTITAFVDAVAGVSKSASASYTITISMPVLTSLAIATPATKTAFQEGEAFISAGLSLTATYRNGYSQTLTQGFTTSPAEGEALAVGTNSVTVSYTEGSVTKTVSYAITVAELPKYAVHFMSNGRLVETITETIANNGVVAPPMNDVTLTVDGEKLTYEFVGWTTTNATKEDVTKPAVLTLTEGKYKPTAETTLYALYKCTTGNFAKGFTLNLTYGGTIYYVGAAGKDKLTSANSAASALILYYDNNCLWYVDSSTKKPKYLYGSSTKTDILFSDSKKEKWNLVETDGIVTLKYDNSTVLALNPNSTGIVRLYGTSYPYQWNLTYTDETYSLGSTTVYTCYPEVNIVTIANMIDRLDAGVSGYTKDDITNTANKVLKK